MFSFRSLFTATGSTTSELDDILVGFSRGKIKEEKEKDTRRRIKKLELKRKRKWRRKQGESGEGILRMQLA
jgi:hypothetical protein